MTNLEWLFDESADFHDAACRAAAGWLGTTSANFADSWLREEHGPCVVPDAPCAGDKMAELETQLKTLKEQRNGNMEKLHELTDENFELRKYRDEWKGIAEKYREDSIAAQNERDAYRELCGKLKAMANEMLVMEVD